MDTLTFKELCTKKFESGIINAIEIPRIQRDYAQGRTSPEVNRIRERFLTNIYDAVTKPEPIILDFVYGDISENVFIPLDGQQRLTTLFLLHWYSSKKENVSEAGCNFLNKFTYKTRPSSRDFCKELVKPDFTPDFEKTLSEFIKDQNWYPLDWKNDPTILSMLVMIDAIQTMFQNVTQIWHTLTSDRKISFYFLPVKNMGLTDDLYIKMNSRGKPLTDFEHFKVEFEKKIKEVSGELHKKDLYENMIHKFDKDWADLLWPYKSNNIVDNEFMRYFYFASRIIYLQDEITYKNYNELEEFSLIKTIYGEENAEKNIRLFREYMDCWYKLPEIKDATGKKLDRVQVFFENIFYLEENKYVSGKVRVFNNDTNYFKRCCKSYGQNAFTFGDTIMLFSCIQYLLHKDTDSAVSESDFRDRIRIVRNSLENSTGGEIRDERMPQLLKDASEIIRNGDIPINSSGFSENQKQEERIKVEWRKKNAQKKDDLYILEDHHLLRGAIAIIGLDNHELFQKFVSVFNANHYNIIRKALLALGDYSQSVSWRFLFGVSNDKSWRDLFTVSSQRGGFDETKRLLNILLSNLPNENITNYLQTLVDGFLINSKTEKTWRYYFLKYDVAMMSGNSGMYVWENCLNNKQEYPYEIIMMNTAESLNGKHWRVFVRALQERCKDSTSLENEYGGRLNLKNGIKLSCNNDHWLLENPDGRTEIIKIPQEDGIDSKDRIEIGEAIIRENVS